MGKIKTGLLIGTALLAGSAIGSGKGLSLLEFGENILTCFVELFNSITGQSVGAEEKGEDIPSTIDETKSDAAKRTQQAADMGAAEAVESTDGQALSTDAAEITQAQYQAVHADAQAAILETGTVGAQIPVLGKAVGLKGRENEKDLAQLLHRETTLGGFRVRDTEGRLLSAEESADLLYTEIASRARTASTSEELGTLTSQELKEMLKSGKGMISTDAQVHGAKLSAGLKAGFDAAGLDAFKSESDKSVTAYANAVCDEYGLTDKEREKILPDLKKAVKQGIHDCEWDTRKPSGESKEDNAVFHVISRIESAGLFSRLPDVDILKEYDAGRLAGARRTLSDRKVSADIAQEDDKIEMPDLSPRAEQLLSLSRAEIPIFTQGMEEEKLAEDLER